MASTDLQHQRDIHARLSDVAEAAHQLASSQDIRPNHSYTALCVRNTAIELRKSAGAIAAKEDARYAVIGSRFWQLKGLPQDRELAAQMNDAKQIRSL